MDVNAPGYALPITVALEEQEIKYRAYKSRDRPFLDSNVRWGKLQRGLGGRFGGGRA